MASDWSVYFLLCSDGSYYVGSTSDLRARVQRHQKGRGAHYTRNRRPVRLVFQEVCPDEKAARARERQIKGWTRAKKQALIEGNLAGLKTLARRRSKTGDGV